MSAARRSKRSGATGKSVKKRVWKALSPWTPLVGGLIARRLRGSIPTGRPSLFTKNQQDRLKEKLDGGSEAVSAIGTFSDLLQVPDSFFVKEEQELRRAWQVAGALRKHAIGLRGAIRDLGGLTWNLEYPVPPALVSVLQSLVDHLPILYKVRPGRKPKDLRGLFLAVFVARALEMPATADAKLSRLTHNPDGPFVQVLVICLEAIDPDRHWENHAVFLARQYLETGD